jgi:hypothetical protein
VLNKRGSLRKIVTDAAKIDRTGIEFGFAVRCTVGVAIPLLDARAIDLGRVGDDLAERSALVQHVRACTARAQSACCLPRSRSHAPASRAS